MSQLRLRAVVHGVPAPQGSKSARAIYRGSKRNGTREFTGRVAMTESSKGVGPWRAAVKAACLEAIATQPTPWEPLAEPVDVRITFSMPRGKTVRRPWPSVAPDLDKVVRSTLDAITEAAVWTSDALVVRLLVEELYQGSTGVLGASGAVLEVRDMREVSVEARAAALPGAFAAGTLQNHAASA